MKNEKITFNREDEPGFDTIAVPKQWEKKPERKNYDEKLNQKKVFVAKSPEQIKLEKIREAESAFKDTITRVKGAVSNCIIALKEFRPDIDFRSLATKPANNVEVVKKNFKISEIGSFPTPDVEGKGFYRIHDALREINSDLEGGILIDLKDVTSQNMSDAIENVKYYQGKLDSLKIRIKQFDAILANTVIKFKEVKSVRPGYLDEEKFSERAIGDIKEEILKSKQTIERISIDLSEGINMIDHKFGNKQ